MGLPKHKVSDRMIRRYVKAKGQQSKGAVCIICGQSFDDCPHSFVDFDKISAAIDVALMLGIKP